MVFIFALVWWSSALKVVRSSASRTSRRASSASTLAVCRTPRIKRPLPSAAFLSRTSALSSPSKSHPSSARTCSSWCSPTGRYTYRSLLLCSGYTLMPTLSASYGLVWHFPIIVSTFHSFIFHDIFSMILVLWGQALLAWPLLFSCARYPVCDTHLVHGIHVPYSPC